MKKLTYGLFFTILLLFSIAPPVTASDVWQEVGCVDPTNPFSLVEVLEQTGRHSTFLQLLLEHDAEGYQILADPVLSDKTIWAPSNEALEALSSELDDLSSEDIKKILGYHISPPQSRPNGQYPIITFSFLEENPTEVFRTRTGVLTESDQRIQLREGREGFYIEDARIESTMWCAQAGSVFSITSVITDVEPPSPLTFLGYRLIRLLFYEDIRFTIYTTVAAFLVGTGVAFIINKKRRNL